MSGAAFDATSAARSNSVGHFPPCVLIDVDFFSIGEVLNDSRMNRDGQIRSRVEGTPLIPKSSVCHQNCLVRIRSVTGNPQFLAWATRRW